MKKGNVVIIVAVVIALLLGAGAFLGYQKFIKKPAIVNEQNTEIPRESPQFSPVITSEVETPTDWKVYTQGDQFAGFSLKYPPDLEIKENIEGRDSYVGLLMPDSYIVTFRLATANIQDLHEISIASVSAVGPGVTAEDYINALKKSDLFANYTLENITIGGKSAFKLKNSDSSQLLIIVENLHKKTIAIGAILANKSQSEQFEKILSTFKFTD